MKILFLCGSLEPGRDGVGDYTRRLAAECIRAGNECEIIALNDQHLVYRSTSEELQLDQKTPISCLRFSSSITWKERILMAKLKVRRFSPDLCSLQFVPFSFHNKGLCCSLSGQLRQIAPNKVWHVMFHELWVDSLKKSVCNRSLWKFLQYLIIRHLIWRLSPPLIHSHASPYVDILKKFHPQVRQLALFGNINGQNPNEEKALSLILAKLEEKDIRISAKSELHLAGVFGAVYDEWQPCEFVDKWKNSIADSKRAVIVFFGKGFDPDGIHKNLKKQLSSLVTVLHLGPLPEDLVAGILNCIDFAIATTPWSLLEKSGSVAAFQDFGLSIVVTREDGSKKYSMSQGTYLASEIDKQTLKSMKRNTNVSTRLGEVTKLFLASLRNS